MKYIIYILIFLLCVILQSSVFIYLPLFSIAPNIFLVLAILIAIIGTQRESLVIAFFLGIWLDFASGGLPGVFALIFTLIAQGVHWLFSQVLLPSNAGKYLLVVTIVCSVLGILGFWVASLLFAALHIPVITITFGLIARVLLWQTLYHLLLVYPLYFLVLKATQFSARFSNRVRL